MSNEKQVVESDALDSVQPIIRSIGISDLKDALGKGLSDFDTLPTHLIFLCAIYPILTLILARVAAGYDVLPLIFPLFAGFTLVGPLVATGLYEISRRREQGLDFNRRSGFEVFRCASNISIAILGLALMVIYVIWLRFAQAIYELFFGDWVPSSVMEFVSQVTTTPAGWSLFIVGGGVGFVFAAVVLSISVVSFPLLLDRNVGVVTAVITSMKVVLANPFTMAIWGIIVVVGLVIGSLPLFFGLAVVLPVLGHATWHLYRKAVQL